MLNPIVVLSPEIIGTTLSTEAEVLSLALKCDINATTLSIRFNGTVIDPVTITAANIVGPDNVVNVLIPLPNTPDTYTLLLQNQNGLNLSPVLTLNIVVAKDLDGVRCVPPSGVSISRRKNSCLIKWVTPTYDGFQGVRVSKSESDIGPFQTLSIITKPSSIQKQIISSSSETVDNGISLVTTTKDFVSNVQYSEIEIFRQLGDADTFYVTLSTLVQDQDSKAIYESQYNGPLKCGYVDLKRVSPSDYLALQNQTDIASRIVSQVSGTNPGLDLSPRSEVRDLIIDPISSELSNASVRVWFDLVSRSVSALDQVDDANNDGISDPVDTSDYKQAIASAFSIPVASVQSYIDSLFDVAADNAGCPRIGATKAIGTLKVYTTNQPSQRDEVIINGMVTTVQDEQTPAVNFILRGSAIIDPASAASLYNSAKNRWEVSVPIECDTPGAVGNVGAGTIRRIVSGIPSGWQIINDVATDFGQDQETNSNLASRIQDKVVTGVDTGTKNGLKSVAKAIPGVLDAKIVGANDPEMLRDWDPTRNRHIFGSVDMYIKGVAKSEIDNKTPFNYGISSDYEQYGTYLTLINESMGDGNNSRIRYRVPSSSVLPLAVMEIMIDMGSTSYFLNVTDTIVDNNGTILVNPKSMPYKKNALGDLVTMTSNNYTTLNTSGGTNAIARAFIRYNTGIDYVPVTQPVYSISSISGEDTKIGVLNKRRYRIIKDSDPLLNGNSDVSNDRIVVDQAYVIKNKTIKFVDDSPVTIDEGISLNNGDVIVVKDAADSTIKYDLDVHYSLIPTAQYNTYSIQRLSSATSPIPLNQDTIVVYNGLDLMEVPTLVSNESKTVSLVPTSLQQGFIPNVWLPYSHNLLTLLNDVDLASVSRSSRFIKVQYDNGAGPVTMIQGQDFDIVTKDDGSCSIFRLASSGSRLQEDSVVTVSYFRSEMLDIKYLYPEYISILKNTIDGIRHAGADIVIKDMMETRVDVSVSLEVDAYANIEVIDAGVRTAISIAMDNADTRLTQAELVKQIKNVQGVTNIDLPFRKFSRSDASYEVGIVIPTGTVWLDTTGIQGVVDRVHTRITEKPVLPTQTIASGGVPDAFVGFLYGGERMTRCFSIQELRTPGSFYILGSDDLTRADNGRIMFIPPTKISDPSSKAYKVTYQVFNELGSKDINLSSTEYLRPGTLVLDYKTR
jgi:uncharacterized phage protein gp47/JayE